MKVAASTLIFVVIAQLTFCQGYQKAIIIFKGGKDTLVCSVPITTSFGDRITIYTEDGNEQTILIKNIKYLASAFNAYENIEYNRKGKTENKLMWMEIEGKINLYLEVVMTEKMKITNKNSSETIYGKPLKTYVARKNDITYLIEEKEFAESIIPLIQEYPELIKKVRSGSYTYDNIEELIREYNRLSDQN